MFRRKKGEKIFALPAVDEIAGIYRLSDLTQEEIDKEYIVYEKSQEGIRLRRINYKDPYLIPFLYPVLFPYCEKGWHPKMMDKNEKHFTIADYASTYFAIRAKEFSPVLSSGALLHEFAIQLNHMIELNDISFIHHKFNNMKKVN